MTTAPATAKKTNPSTVYLIVSFALLILILFDPFGWGLRQKLGTIVGYAFDPILGFGSKSTPDVTQGVAGAHPLITILLSSIVLVVATTAIRHFLVDWVKMARVQEAMRSFQKEFMQARKDNNTYKLKKLTEAQPEVMSMQADLSTEQLKPMAWTMLIVIPIFAWLSAFVAVTAHALPAGECGITIKAPWTDSYNLTGPVACGGSWWFLPHWIILYSLFGIPIGQLAQRALKLWEYRSHKVELDALEGA